MDASFTFPELAQAYFDCRKRKRNTASALHFEQDLERNLARLDGELRDGSYQPGASICFVVTRPKPREVWAADFRDRVVHHLLYNRIAPRFHASFVVDTCACIPGRGTMYAAQRLESKIRSVTQNWSQPAHYLKCDLANFFVAIDKRVLRCQLANKIHERWWMRLTDQILFHDPRPGALMRSTHTLMARVPAHKSLLNQPAHLGLPIGNLSSQFFANVYLNTLDQYIKHQVGAKHYVRYVDDFILLHPSTDWLIQALNDINVFLPRRLGARLNPSKTILQPIARGVDFVGHVIRPWHRVTRKRLVSHALHRISEVPSERLLESVNSYFGLLAQSPKSHGERARIAKVARYRGLFVNMDASRAIRPRHSVSAKTLGPIA